MISCTSGKNSYESQYEAEQALLENWIRYHHSQDSGPQNVYQCEDCGSFHFTSRGPMNEFLMENLDSIRKQRLARDWEQKLR